MPPAVTPICDALPTDPLASGMIELRPDRRDFLCVVAGCCAAALCCFGARAWGDEFPNAHEARFYEKLAGGSVRCKLCPRGCVVASGGRGYCRVRENRGGRYYSLVYSRVVAAHIDPIEKKPFFHFRPGAMAFSIATGGCNVNCKFCQNWEISQAPPEQLRSLEMPPAEVAAQAERYKCEAMAYTYSEPIVFSEFVLDCADAGHARGVRSVMVSNGFIRQEPLQELCRHLDAIKIDLKAFSEQYYRDVVRGELRPVLDSIVLARKHAKWLEIVYLTVPTLNDSDDGFRALAKWIKSELGPDVPIHFTRFYPKYLLQNLPPTPVETLERAKAICDAEGLHYAYIGNVPGHAAENTYCPKCRKLLLERLGLTVTQNHVRGGRCEYCRAEIAGVWK